MRPPKISVVMPVYNRAYCISDAIRSVIDQDFKDWELIIVDDGSDDSEGLIRVLQSYDDKRIRYERIEHTGRIGAVRNHGNRMAKANIIVVHDSDDMALPDRLDSIFQCFIHNPDTDVVYHGMYTRMLDDKHGAVARQVKYAETYSQKRLLQEQYIPGQVAYTKEIILKYPYDERIQCCDDWQMLLELSLNRVKFKALDKQLYEYVYLEDSVNVSGEASGKRKADMEIIIDILKKKYKIKANAKLKRHLITPKK